MVPVYDADNLIDAQLVLDLLLDAGLQAHVSGAALSGGVGELPVSGLVKVWVRDDQAEAARACLADWQAAEVPDADELDRLAGDGAPEGELLA